MKKGEWNCRNTLVNYHSFETESFFCCHLADSNVDTGQHAAAGGGILFYVGSYTLTINDRVGCTYTLIKYPTTLLILVCLHPFLGYSKPNLHFH
jgi:hypothetical protein